MLRDHRWNRGKCEGSWLVSGFRFEKPVGAKKSSPVAEQVKERALSLLWCRFNSRPRNSACRGQSRRKEGRKKHWVNVGAHESSGTLMRVQIWKMKPRTRLHGLPVPWRTYQMKTKIQLLPNIYSHFCKNLFLGGGGEQVIMKELEFVPLLLGKMLNCKRTALLLCMAKANVFHLCKYFQSLAGKKWH